MKYYIGTTLDPEIDRYLDDLFLKVKREHAEIAMERIHTFYMTFKAPFEMDDTQLETLKGACTAFGRECYGFQDLVFSSPLLITPTKVALVADEMSQKILNGFQKDFINFLKDAFPWMEFSKYDESKIHHITLFKTEAAKSLPAKISGYLGSGCHTSVSSLALFRKDPHKTIIDRFKLIKFP